MQQEIIDKIAKIKLLITDVDGVLTDGKIYLGTNSLEFKAFHVHDGKGIKLLQEAGVEVAIITGRQSEAVSNRAKELAIKDAYQGVKDKIAVFNNLLERYNLSSDQVAYIGDDINDLEVLTKVGFSASVANGVAKVKERVDYVTEKAGGEGALRELAELILSNNLQLTIDN